MDLYSKRASVSVLMLLYRSVSLNDAGTDYCSPSKCQHLCWRWRSVWTHLELGWGLLINYKPRINLSSYVKKYWTLKYCNNSLLPSDVRFAVWSRSCPVARNLYSEVGRRSSCGWRCDTVLSVTSAVRSAAPGLIWPTSWVQFVLLYGSLVFIFLIKYN